MAIFRKYRQSTSSRMEVDDSYFISISDLMASLIFFFIITIVVLIINYQTAIKAHEDKSVEILKSLQFDFQKEGVLVTVDEEQRVMRLPEKVLFRTGHYTLTAEGKKNVKMLGEKLFEHIVKNQNIIDAVFIEGHADKQPWPGQDEFGSEMENLSLSVKRAVGTYGYLKKNHPELCELKNTKGQRILNVSGYGQYRPVDPTKKRRANREDRRIEIRFVMTPAESLLRETESQEARDNQPGRDDI